MSSFEDVIETPERRDMLAGTFVHEDESRTFVYYGDSDDMDFSDPREHDGNVVHLVSESRDYKDLDDADNDLAALREVADLLNQREHGAWEYRETRNEEREESYLYIAAQYGGTWLDLDDEHEGYVALGFMLGLDAEKLIRRYIAAKRPDVVHYEHHWQVNGSSQSDWREGWAYVLQEDLDTAELTPEWMTEHELTPAKLYEQEIGVFQKWFAGEVYYARHIDKGDEQFTIGAQGGYFIGTHDYTEDTCGGFLGYDQLKDIAGHFTDSPVIEEN